MSAPGGGGVAIVGVACRYPDAASPAALWENVLAGRRAFRRLPEERLRLADYYDADRSAPDRCYAAQAAVLTDYAFARERFRIAASTVRSTDLAHWLALDVAAAALADAGFPDADGAPRDTTMVVVGNTLTGDLSRANSLRLRWPYVRRVVDAALDVADWPAERRASWLAELEVRFKAPFPAVDEDSLAGGLSNTIAGRVCNQFDLHGGGYTVDGACASSLLAVITGCTALAAGDADLVLAGGVDLSLDPFELVGFAKAGALAVDAMRVYDARASGFWPGEGCGVVALMREADAVAEARAIYAVLRGWGVSSDGSGGITRPTVRGQRLAVERAYRRAGFGADAVGLFEGHGTGTSVGDATELRVLSAARTEALARAHGATAYPGRAAIGSIKANIGHTKAAAGLAGLVKAALAVRERVIPPTTGCEAPHAELAREDAVLEPLGEARPWPDDVLARAAVSAMGFGGINTHVVLEEPGAPRPRRLTAVERALAASPQSCEILVLGADDAAALGRAARALAARVEVASLAELGDIAAALAARVDGLAAGHSARAAVVAAAPAAAAARLRDVARALECGERGRLDAAGGVFLGVGGVPPRVGFLCPGQGGPVPTSWSLLGRRFPEVEEVPGEWVAVGAGPVDTAAAQPNVVRGSLAGLRALARLAVRADVALGHSLGEIVALYWGGALDEGAAWRVAAARGRAMSDCDGSAGAMASVAASVDVAEDLIAGTSLVVAGRNGPRQTVVSGERALVDALLTRARAAGVAAVRLAVSHAFHSPLVAPAVAAIDRTLAGESLRAPVRRVASTVTGRVLPADADVRALLRTQVTAPVRFADALAAVASEVDLWIEIGPGEVLCGLVRDVATAPALPLRVESDDALALCTVAAAAYVRGAPVDVAALFEWRFTRPVDLARRPAFLASPCELAPADAPNEDAYAAPAVASAAVATAAVTTAAVATDGDAVGADPVTGDEDALTVVRRLTAARAELPLDAVRPDDRLLADLHLSSISVGEIVAGAARALGIAASVVATEYANATVAEVAAALAGVGVGAAPPGDPAPAGVAPWVRAFAPALVERARPPRRAVVGGAGWTVIARPGNVPAAELRERLTGEPGGGTVVCLDPAPDEQAADHDAIPLLLAAARHTAQSGAAPLVVVHDGSVVGAGAFARALHLERPGATTCVVIVPNADGAADAVVEEARAARGFTEAHVDAAGVRRVPVLRAHPLVTDAAVERAGLGALAGGLLLVTGGGKGIAAECALDLALRTGARLLLLGRADPAADPALAAALDRLRAAGVEAVYRAADVTDARAVREAVSGACAALGPVTAVLHAAGVNDPSPVDALDAAAVRRTVAPKVDGARNVLAAVDPARLRLWVSFGSVIGRAGLPGEAHYAFANAELTRFTEELQARLPACRCRCVEWSVWAGVGMGERLGRVEALTRQGITPLGVDDGLAALRRVIADPACPTAVVVAGRLGDAPTVEYDATALPLLRFVESPRVRYPGVELVVDATLARATDPYVDDHVFGGERLLPAVVALEAIAQVAHALAPDRRLTAFEGLELLRPVVVPADGDVTVRVAALAREDGGADVVVRSSATAFAVDHVRATCRFAPGDASNGAHASVAPTESGTAHGDVPCATDAAPLYASILFQRGRFRRLAGYDALTATACRARLAALPPNGAPWFGEFLPQTLLLGDAGARDACLHAVQACVPHSTLLPVGADLVELLDPSAAVAEVRASEVARDGELFTYDVEALAAHGTTVERWRGARFRVVAGPRGSARRPAVLLGPYVERRIMELLGARVSVTAAAAGTRAAARESALARLGMSAIGRRPDGRAAVRGEATVSLAYARAESLHLALAVAARGGGGGGGRRVRPGVRFGARGRAVGGPARTWRRGRRRRRPGRTRRIGGRDVPRVRGERRDVRVGGGRGAPQGGGAARAPRPRTRVRGRVGRAARGRARRRRGVRDRRRQRGTARRGRGGAIDRGRAARGARAGVGDEGAAMTQPAPAFELRHVVSFEETNLVGNVYFARHLSWQGRCRELFLRAHAPDVVEALSAGLSLVTLRCSCEYYAELRALEEVVIRMRLDGIAQNRIALRFDYARVEGTGEQPVARGHQEVACMRRDGGRLVPTAIPESLREALRAYEHAGVVA